jgi:Domain of unknown function (DUF5667)
MSGGPLRRTLGRAWRTAVHLRVPPPAQRLAEALDDPVSRQPEPGSQEAVLVGVASQLPFVGVRPAPEFRAALHERLLAEPSPVPAAALPPAVVEPVAEDPAPNPAGTQDHRPAMRPHLRAAIVAVVVAVALIAGAIGTVAASRDALPGQPLYAAKRSMEQVRLALTFEKVARGERLLELAEARVDEAEALLERDASTTSDDVAAVNEALSGAHRRIVEADDVLLTAYRLSGDPQPAQVLDDAARDLHDRLVELPPAAPQLEASSAALVATLEQVLLRTSSISD